LPILEALEAELDESARTGKDPPTACERVEIANNRGWGELLANEACAARGETPAASPRATLERALAIPGCDDAYVRGFALANVARLSLDEGDLDGAERRLAAAKADIKEPRGTERLAWLELEGRILLGRRRPSDALRVIDGALSLARASVSRATEWSLLVTRAQALEALGRPTDAIGALEAAEDALGSAALSVPLGEGREAFTSDRSRSARALVGLLVQGHREREAAAAGRRARARVLSSVERALRLETLGAEDRARWEDAVRAFRTARAAIDLDAAGDWRLPSDRLARVAVSRAAREHELGAALETAMSVLEAQRGSAQQPAPDAQPEGLAIDVYPDLQGFVAIAADAKSASAHRVPIPPVGHAAKADELSTALFGPIEASIARAGLVTIRTYGAWRGVDVHALVWHGAPLLAHVPVVYAIDAGGPRATARTGPAVVVGDPTGDLPGALDEAHEAARALANHAHGADVPVRLLVRDEATSRATLGALCGASILHYAGHGIFAGPEGWESALPLAGGGRLTVADVLSLAPTPNEVILAGCEAAASSGDGEGLGLAQAFLVAGSGEVLAPVRRVPDQLSAKLARALYAPDVTEDGGAPSRRTLAARARRAILELRHEDPESDWAAYRVLAP
jgi:hypothetical protein